MRRTPAAWRTLLPAALLAVLAAGITGAVLAQAPLAQAPTEAPADLFSLATADDGKALTSALRAGADPDVRDAYGQTPLMYAADHGHSAALVALLGRGADPNARSGAGWTALMYALRHDFLLSWTLVDDLLLHGADPTPRNEAGDSAADMARERGFDEVARRLEAYAPIHLHLDPWGVQRVARLVTETGTYTAAVIDMVDAVLVRTQDGGSEVVVQLTEHAGFAALLEDTRLRGRYVVGKLALVDVDGDGYPELYAAGGCECHGFTFDVLVDGASGAALLVETFPYGDLTPSLVNYEYPEAAPAWMRFYLAGALAARYGTPLATESVTYTQEVRYQAR